MRIGIISSIILIIALSSCATQRYGRAAPVSDREAEILDCKQVELEIVKTEAFLEDVRRQRSDVSGAHVLGALGDFGIGNVMEGDAAEQSGIDRLDKLRALQRQKKCRSETD